jgi:hypothetical protein
MWQARVCATAADAMIRIAGLAMNKALTGLALIAATVAAHANDTPAAAALSSQQAQARQFGIFVGGTASQYDLCAKKGFLAKPAQSAEETAKAILEKMRESGPDQSAYVQEGWDMMKKEISEHPAFFTKEKCSWVGKEWAKILTTMRAN